MFMCVCVCEREGGKVYAFVRLCVYMWFSNVCACFCVWLCFMRVSAVVFDVLCVCVWLCKRVYALFVCALLIVFVCFWWFEYVLIVCCNCGLV